MSGVYLHAKLASLSIGLWNGGAQEFELANFVTEFLIKFQPHASFGGQSQRVHFSDCLTPGEMAACMATGSVAITIPENLIVPMALDEQHKHCLQQVVRTKGGGKQGEDGQGTED